MMLGNAVLLSALVITCAHITLGNRVSCYYSSWEVDGPYSVELIPGNLCTHVIYAFATLSTANWSIVASDPNLDIGESGYYRFTGLKNSFPGLKTTIAIGGGSDDGSKYSELVSDPQKIQTFVSSVVAFLSTYNFDGLDFDWENPGNADRGGQPADKENFVNLLQALSTAFQPYGWELTLAVSVVQPTVANGYDIPNICTYATAIHCMAYDFHGDWDNYADVHTPLYPRSYDPSGADGPLNVADGMAIWSDGGCPLNKLVMGTAFYGNSFQLASAANNYEGAPSIQGGTYPTSLSFLQLCETFNDGSWTEVYDTEGMVYYRYKDDFWVGYDKPNSLQDKMNFALGQGYLGAMVWSINQDDLFNACGLGTSPMLNVVSSNMMN